MAGISRPGGAIAGIVLLTAGPFAGLGGLLFLKYLSPWRSEEAALLFWAAGLVVGVLGLWLLPVKRLYRALLSVPYAAGMALATMPFALMLACRYFGDCV
jgi:hypothetical protein